jgi:hypothetical protein
VCEQHLDFLAVAPGLREVIGLGLTVRSRLLKISTSCGQRFQPPIDPGEFAAVWSDT